MIFFLIELRIPQPMMELRLFRDRLFASAVTATGPNGLARGAVTFLLIFFLQGPYGAIPCRRA